VLLSENVEKFSFLSSSGDTKLLSYLELGFFRKTCSYFVCSIIFIGLDLIALLGLYIEMVLRDWEFLVSLGLRECLS